MGAVVTVKRCHSSQNQGAGYWCMHGCQMTVISSDNVGDKKGCLATHVVEHGGYLTMEKVTVDVVLQYDKTT